TGTGRCPADGGALAIRGTVGARPGAHLGDVARTGTRPARESRGLEGIAGTARRDPVTHLRHVARTGRCAAGRPRVPPRVLAGRSAPAAHVAGAGVAVVGAR